MILTDKEKMYLTSLKVYLHKNAAMAPFDHQVLGVLRLLQHPYFLLADEMGAGKTKQVIDAAQMMFIQGTIDRVLVICPSSVRSVWFDPVLGEITKHTQSNIPLQVAEFRQKVKIWKNTNKDQGLLKWVVTNYDFIRSTERLKKLGKVVGPRTLLVLDESSYVKNHKAQQTQACKKLRLHCGRVVLLNGTPLTEGLGDLYSQADIMHPQIFGCKNWFQYRARYAVLGGWQNRSVVSWRGIDEIQRKLAPYVLRRLKKDCLDLPEKLPSVSITVTLKDHTWRMYKQMEQELIVWLQTAEASVSQHAAVRTIRLQQITSGFIGGVKHQMIDQYGEVVEGEYDVDPIKEIGNEKQDALIEWMDDRIHENPNFKVVVWSRHTWEILETIKAFKRDLPSVQVGVLIGGQKEQERNYAKQLLDPRTTPPGPVAVIGNSATGGMGLTLTAADHVVYMSNYYRLITRLQSEDRVHRPGQINNCSYFDMIAVGPRGQKTIDHTVVKRLLMKQDVANMTTAAWISELRSNGD